jgi:hypothetical protein
MGSAKPGRGRRRYRVIVPRKKGLASAVRRLATPVEELDRVQLREYCDALGLTPTTDVEPRTRVRVGGEVRSVRVVPRAGAPALEVNVNDGLGSATAVFLGRRNIAGINPGRKMIVEGIAGKYGNRFLIFNPLYTLLP